MKCGEGARYRAIALLRFTEVQVIKDEVAVGNVVGVLLPEDS
jgi:hypothetical protein